MASNHIEPPAGLTLHISADWLVLAGFLALAVAGVGAATASVFLSGVVAVALLGCVGVAIAVL